MEIEDFKKKESEPWFKTTEVKGTPASLNLVENHLFATKKHLDSFVIYNMIRMIGEGKTLPPVYVVNPMSNVYFLTRLLNPQTGKIDGGNSRAYAHFKSGKNLNAIVVPTEHIFRYSTKNIRDLQMKERDLNPDIRFFFDKII